MVTSLDASGAADGPHRRSNDPGIELFDGREMVMIHDVLRREFALLPGVVASITLDERGSDRADNIASHIDWLMKLLHLHHSTEDRYIWPLLVERCDQTTLTARMGHQHEEVSACLDAIEEALETWCGDNTTESSDALKHALRELITSLSEHLNDEEQHVVPLMERYITAAEVSRPVEEGLARIKPDEMPLLIGMMMYEGDPEIIDRLLAALPPDIGATIRQVAPQAFAMHCQRVQGTPTPPRSTELFPGRP